MGCNIQLITARSRIMKNSQNDREDGSKMILSLGQQLGMFGKYDSQCRFMVMRNTLSQIAG